MKRLKNLLIALTGITLLPLISQGARADDPPAGEIEALQKRTLEILNRRCGECHGERRPSARLALHTFEAVARGNPRGAVIVPGNPGESLLWEVVDDERMPPKVPLPEAERLVLRKWIAIGAPGVTVPGNRHWSFQPVLRPSVPNEVQGIAGRNNVDRFLAEKLAARNLKFRPEASRATLIRRVSFDLTGLPPTSEELDRFLQDESANAYSKMVDYYLDSPRYGERWGKYWLDIAGYADSNGYFNADTHRPLAWKYRDWVIRALNGDRAYDEFVREQIAGDELVGYVRGGDVTPEMVASLTATHFLRNAQDGSGESDGNPDEVMIDRLTAIEGNLQNTIHGLLGLTIQCAKCHSHKFEPISHEEYYRLQAILFSAYLPAKWLKPNERAVTVGTVAERETHQRQTDRIDRQIAAYKSSLERITNTLQEQVIEDRLEGLPQEERKAVLEAVRVAADKRNEAQKELIKKHVDPLKLSDDDIIRKFPDYAATRDGLKQSIAAREALRPKPLEALAILSDVDPSPPAHHVFLRGQHNQPGPEVLPGVLSIVTTSGNPFLWKPPAEGQKTSGRRLALARWLTSADNPLFARVMVNRIWQFHFGTGLVPTPDNFGQAGTPPTHPELLDWLTAEFIANGWRLKPVHRLLLHSAAYRQGSEFDATAAGADPANRLWWRYPTRRLDAEALRDAMLAVTGRLDLATGGPCVMTTRAQDGTVVIDPKNEGRFRRSIYLQQRRTQVMTFLELFDAPKIVTNCTVRNTSTVPLQSLAMLNSDFTRECSTALAQRVAPIAAGDPDRFVTAAYRLACSRNPTAKELAASKSFLEMQTALYSAADATQSRDAEASGPRSPVPDPSPAHVDFCQMLLASNAFLYVD